MLLVMSPSKGHPPTPPPRKKKVVLLGARVLAAGARDGFLGGAPAGWVRRGPTQLFAGPGSPSRICVGAEMVSALPWAGTTRSKAPRAGALQSSRSSGLMPRERSADVIIACETGSFFLFFLFSSPLLKI